MADQCIGKLTLDISDVEKKIDQINEALSKAGSKVNVDISKEIGKEVKAQLDSVLKEIKGYEGKIAKAVDNAINGVSGSGKRHAQSAELKEAIQLWKEYYNVLAKAEASIKRGDVTGGMSLRNDAEQIKARASALRDEAEVTKEIASARKKYEDAYRSTGLADRAKTEAEGQK